MDATVRRRPEVVWSVLTDVSALPAWVDGLVAASVDEGSPRGVGLRLDVARDGRRMRFDGTCEVTAWREPSMLALETRALGLLALDRATLTPVPGGTLLEVRAELMFVDPFGGIFARRPGLLGGSADDPALQAIYERSVEALVKRIEALSAVPYR